MVCNLMVYGPAIWQSQIKNEVIKNQHEYFNVKNFSDTLTTITTTLLTRTFITSILTPYIN